VSDKQRARRDQRQQFVLIDRRIAHSIVAIARGEPMRKVRVMAATLSPERWAVSASPPRPDCKAITGPKSCA